VLNGWELGSGSVRIHRADIQSRVFRALGISDEEAESRFGFLLGAFKYGAPPHAGFAFGIDRLVAIFAGEENIREVIAFPKTQSGADLMTGAPKGSPKRQMRELHHHHAERFVSYVALRRRRRQRLKQVAPLADLLRPRTSTNSSDRTTWSERTVRCAVSSRRGS
jgi:hypothetical protein